MSPSRYPILIAQLLFVMAIVGSAARVQAADAWSSPSFSVDPAALRQAADGIKPAKDALATVFLNEFRYTFDAGGKMDKVWHLIYRIENEQGVKNWAGTKGYWKPWYQSQPEIKVRVIGPDGAVRTIDPATLTDVAVHQESSDMYSDERAYGGPIPAVVPGAIIEEEITTHATGVMFSGGTVQRIRLPWTVPVNKSRIVLAHPESLPLRYVLHLLPDAVVGKSVTDGVETIVIEKNGLEAQLHQPVNAPYDSVLSAEVEFSTGVSWANVTSDYARLLNEKFRVEDARPLLANVDIKKGGRREIVSRIVSALHHNVRYTGVEFGQSSFVPQFPAETLKRKYGDCKDKATLLITALRAAGIPANLALLSSGSGQDINVDLPGVGMFDHAIVYVPASGSDPELWIDATAQYSRVGYLPLMDSGRWALVIDEKTTAPRKIPELTAEQNAHIETREFTLAEFGQAKIVEKDEEIGPLEANYRDYYSKDTKEVRQGNENYVKEAYLADSLGAFDKDDPNDLSRPFIVTFTAKGNRGYTELQGGTAAIRVEALFNRLPAWFLTPEKTGDKPAEGDDAVPRTVDWQLSPFLTEWRYTIAAPPGFKIRALPPDKEEHLGTALFSQKYSVDNAGIVHAVLRFNSGRARLSVDEAKALRDAVIKTRKSNPVMITFDQTGYALLAAGKTREALAAFRQLAAMHPKEALHKVQIARVLLDAGLAEEARDIAREAVALEPNSTQAQETLGLIMQHDLMGRRFKKGSDLKAAVAAYRKAVELDPKDKDNRANLAILLEYDADGVRYTAGAALKEAVAEFRELKKLDEGYAHRFDDNVLYDLWYAHEFKEVGEFAAGLPRTDDQRGFLLAAMAASEGAQAALKKSLEITSGETERGKSLVNAGFLLLRARKYAQAAELLEAGARGQENESQLAATVAILKKTRQHQEIAFAATDPRGAAHRFLESVLSRNPDFDTTRRMMTGRKPAPDDLKADREEFNRSMAGLRAELETDGLSIEVVADMALSNMRYSLEGDENIGYHISAEAPGSQAQEVFIVREDGEFRIAEFTPSNGRYPAEICWQVLARLEKNDLAGARRWLDWAREKIHATGGDDPLAIQPFARFWTKGQEGDADAIRRAALVLMPPQYLKGADLAAVMHARDAAGADSERTALDLVLAFAYGSQDRYTELQPVAQELIKVSPDSLRGLALATQAFAVNKKFDDWDKLLTMLMQKHPDELEYTRSSARLAEYRGDYLKARQLQKGLMDRGKANEDDLNSYAWESLSLPAGVDEESVVAARRASDLTKNSNFAILHTLACLYAAQGKPTQGREVLLKAMDSVGMDQPNDAVWLALGIIAEQYGENEAARGIYTRIEKPKIESPGSSWEIARARMAALPKPEGKSAKIGGR